MQNPRDSAGSVFLRNSHLGPVERQAPRPEGVRAWLYLLSCLLEGRAASLMRYGRKEAQINIINLAEWPF